MPPARPQDFIYPPEGFWEKAYPDIPEIERISYDGSRPELWNKLALSHYLNAVYGTGSVLLRPQQVRTPTDEMTDEEKASLSNGLGYQKVSPRAEWHHEVSGVLAAQTTGFTFENLEELGQPGNLPRPLIAATDADLNAGLRAMLILFKGRLKLVNGTGRQYWWPFDQEFSASPLPGNVHEQTGIVTAYEYKWETPGLVENPSAVHQVDTDTLRRRYWMTTPYWWNGHVDSMGEPEWETAENAVADPDDPNTLYAALPLTYLDGEEQRPNRFRRLPFSRFWLVAAPSDMPDQFIEKYNTVQLFDYEWTKARTREDRRVSWDKQYV
jgi:hypothetical protein